MSNANIEQVEGVGKSQPQEIVAAGGSTPARETGPILAPFENVLALTNSSSQIMDHIPLMGVFFIRSLLLPWQNALEWRAARSHEGAARTSFGNLRAAATRRLRAKCAKEVEE
jgi:hypothetical protein